MKIITIVASLLLLTSTSHALFEVRAGYGLRTPGSDAQAGTEIKSLYGFNVDALVNLPMIPIGVGLRYEDMGLDLAASGVTANVDSKRTALLVNYRLINTLAYFGPIAGIGFSNDLEIKGAVGGFGANTKYTADMTYNIGVEGGIGLGLMQVGAEAGYFSGTYTSSGSSDLDMSGIYLKALVGFGF